MDRTPARSVRPFILAWCICLIIMELLGAGFDRSGLNASFDFRAFYSAGYLMRTHPSQLYDLTQQDRVQEALITTNGFMPFYHPSYEALLFAPFSFLNYRSAYLAFIGFNMLLLMAAFFAARPVFSSVIPLLQPRPGLMFFAFVPLLAALMQGQDSILLLLLCCLAWRRMEAGKDASAGFLLALALFKFQIIIPIVVLIAIRRNWRFAVGFLVTAAGIVCLCIAAVGGTGVESLVEILSGAITATNKGNALAQHAMSIHPSAMPNIAGFLYACGTRFVSPHVSLAITGVCSFLLLGWAARILRQCEWQVAFSVAVLCGLLVSYHLLLHDVTLALLPLALLTGRTQRYLLLAVIGLPVVLVQMGSNWLFLLALPLGAMLAYASISSREPITAEPEMAQAAPVQLKAA